MPKIALEVKMNLENLKYLAVFQNGEPFRWYIKLKCSSCGESRDTWQYVVVEDKQQVDGSRGSANLVEKCKMCGRQNQLEVVRNSLQAYDGIDKNLQWQSLIVFDCRGLEPIDFDPRVGWIAEAAESQSKFRDIDLKEKEWYEFDEKSNLAVSISEWEHRFVKTKLINQ